MQIKQSKKNLKIQNELITFKIDKKNFLKNWDTLFELSLLAVAKNDRVLIVSPK